MIISKAVIKLITKVVFPKIFFFSNVILVKFYLAKILGPKLPFERIQI